MDILFWYIDLHQNSDVRLAFEALKVTLQLVALYIAAINSDVITVPAAVSGCLQLLEILEISLEFN